MERQTANHSLSRGDVILSCEPWVWCFHWDEYPSFCAYCLSEQKGLSMCSRCRVHRYCSTKCQVADWKKEHKLECDILKGLAPHITVVEKVKGTLPDESVDASAMMLLLSKIKRKMQANTLEKIPELGPKSVESILSLFPNQPGPNEASLLCKWFPSLNPELTGSGWPATGPSSFLECFRVVAWNAFPIVHSDTAMRTVGVALFPQAPHRRMTAVCWDSNVSMDFRGRRLVVRATEDIPSYQGLKDLRNCAIGKPFYLTRTERIHQFAKVQHDQCSCRKCSTEYDAEINPLTCTTTGCLERLPSDQRSLAPCPQCGVVNPDRLEQFQRFVDQYAVIQQRGEENRSSEVERLQQMRALLTEIDASGIVYADAHLRFLCGRELGKLYEAEGKYEEAWKLHQEVIDCMRRILPKHDRDLAHCLLQTGRSLIKYIHNERVAVANLEKELPTDDALKARKSPFGRLVPLLCNDYMIWMGYCYEAREIFAKQYGQDSKWVKETQGTIDCLKSITDAMVTAMLAWQ